MDIQIYLLIYVANMGLGSNQDNHKFMINVINHGKQSPLFHFVFFAEIHDFTYLVSFLYFIKDAGKDKTLFAN